MTDAHKKPAVVLVSGGLDSATTMAIAKSEGFDLYALSFRYGQRHAIELEAAVRVAKAFQSKQHHIMNIDLRAFGGSALTDNIDVPKNRPDLDDMKSIPVTYVPARNTVFLSFAMAYAEVLKANDIFIGINAVDYSGYPDCRPQFIEAFQKMANLATKAGVEGQKLTIHTPLASLKKSEIIQLGTSLGVDYALTLSCYDPDSEGRACGSCDSCRLRKKGFEDANIADVTSYQ